MREGNFGGYGLRNLDENIREANEIEKGALSSEILGWQDGRVKETDFAPIYGDLIVKGDIKKVDVRVAGYTRTHASKPVYEQMSMKRGRENSALLESMLGNKAIEWGWFGKDARVRQASEYDDHHNNTDLYIEFPCGVLAVDVTMHTHTERVRQKMTVQIEKILGGAPNEIKYFEPADKNAKRGCLKRPVPVVIGLDGNNTEALLRALLTIRKIERQEGETATKLLADEKRKLSLHPAQILILREIRDQLELYETLLVKKQKTTSALSLETVTALKQDLNATIRERIGAGAAGSGVSDKVSSAVGVAISDALK